MKVRKGFVSNSSSCSYVCESKYTIAKTKKILIQILNFYNELFEEDHKFKDVFKNPFIGTHKTKVEYEEWEHPLYNENRSVVGKIIIDSKEDNSIPYPIMQLIESKFHATHYHWG